MNVVVFGAGAQAVALQPALTGAGHAVAAIVGALPSAGALPLYTEQLGVGAAVVLADELRLGEAELELLEALRRQLFLVVFASPGSAVLAWAQGAGVAAFPYPPNQAAVAAVVDLLTRAERGVELPAAPPAQVELSGRVGVSVLAVTGPKGGTGKTFVASGLSLVAALSGVETFLVDADANGGTLDLVLPPPGPEAPTLPGLLREYGYRQQWSSDPLAGWGAEAALARHFSPLERLPALKVLYGVAPDRVGDPVLQDPERVESFVDGLIRGLAGRLLVFDLGHNPAVLLHRAVLRRAQGLVLVARPELSSLRGAAAMFLAVVEALSGPQVLETLSRLKLVINDVDGQVAPKLPGLQRELAALIETGLAQRLGDRRLRLQPAAVLPRIPPALASPLDDGYLHPVLRFHRRPQDHPELAPFVEGLVTLLSGFIPITDAARRAGLLPAPAAARRRPGILGLLGR